MPGIDKINQQKEDQPKSSGFSNRTELIMNQPGDVAVVAVVSDGSDSEDDRLSSYARHSYQDDDGRWIYAFCKGTVDKLCSMCEEGRPVQNRFAFWAYVYALQRKVAQQGDSWRQETKGKETVWTLDINDFRMVTLPFGRQDTFWKQFTDVYYEHGAMNKVALRITRDGSGRETSWRIATTPKTINWDELPSNDNLPSVKDHFLEIEAQRQQAIEAVSLSDSNDDDESGLDVESLF